MNEYLLTEQQVQALFYFSFVCGIGAACALVGWAVESAALKFLDLHRDAMAWRRHQRQWHRGDLPTLLKKQAY